MDWKLFPALKSLLTTQAYDILLAKQWLAVYLNVGRVSLAQICVREKFQFLCQYIYPWEFDWTTKMKDVEVDEYGLKMGQAKDKIFLP